MTLTPQLRKLALTLHVVASVGWIGAVGAFLALSIAGVVSTDAAVVSAAYVAMDLITKLVIVPFALASSMTGLVSSLGTRWGLFRHYWVLLKTVITIPATILLLVHMQVISYVGTVAASTALSAGDLGRMRTQLVFDAVAGLVVLLAVTALSVYRPRGRTPYGRRKLREMRTALKSQS